MELGAGYIERKKKVSSTCTCHLVVFTWLVVAFAKFVCTFSFAYCEGL